MIELGKLVDKFPDVWTLGVKLMRAIFVDMDAFSLFRIAITPNVIALINYQYRFSSFERLSAKRSPK